MGNRFEVQPGTTCPRCGAASPCVDWNEVDIGVGVQTFDHEYECPTHGCFAFAFEHHQTRPIFRDDRKVETKT
jgi:hypothetical protein